MRSARATLAVAIITLLTGATAAHAAPVDVHVRVEGVTSTIVDRVMRTDGHDVRAASDRQAHTCDGTNNGANPVPGPTAMAATADALASIGQTFDGQWYPGYEDYFIRQLGPEREDNDQLWWWGILVNRTFSPVGGCQRRVRDGDEVLWANDAFSSRPFLWLAAATATPAVLVGAPLALTVTSTDASTASDDLTGAPWAGAQLGAVTATGQPAAAGAGDGGTSAADGSATVTFHQTGWQRAKARAPGAIASNSVDVCVEPAPGAGCAGAPPSREPPGVGGGGKPIPLGGGSRGRNPARRSARPAWLRRFAPDSLRDDRARGVRREGAWARVHSAFAWRGTLSRGGADALLRVRLGAGRPAFLLRPGAGRARIELRAGGRVVQVALPAGRAGTARIVLGPLRRRRGGVALRVLSGTVRVDAVGRAA